MKGFIITVLFIFFFVFYQQIAFASEKLRITASFYPLAHFAEKIGGDYVEVIDITPSGVDPHEYEPTARDIKRIWTSDVFIFNGGGIDPWAERLYDDLKKEELLIVYMAAHFDLLKADKQGKNDPHIWLDPLLALKEVKIIRDAIIRADPEHADYYRKKSTVYLNKLVALHDKYQKGLKSCKTRNIIVSHDAFGYLARRYGLEVIPIAGLSPEEEPSPRRMAKISRIAREKNIQYIFNEVLVSTKIAETVSNEIGADILVLNPIGGLTKDEIKTGKTYLSIMDENLSNLRLALSCK